MTQLLQAEKDLQVNLSGLSDREERNYKELSSDLRRQDKQLSVMQSWQDNVTKDMNTLKEMGSRTFTALVSGGILAVLGYIFLLAQRG